MGAGKTTVGRHLASLLEKRFVDADCELEARTGVKISVIFEIEGEQGFRRREAELLHELTHQSNIVLATGGGAVNESSTRELLKTRGYTIYLAANPTALAARTRRDHRRPLLQNADPELTLLELLRQREPFYREVADLVVETGHANIARLTASILESLRATPETRSWVDAPQRPTAAAR